MNLTDIDTDDRTRKGSTRPLLGSGRQLSCIAGFQDIWAGTHGFDHGQSNLPDTHVAMELAQDSKSVRGVLNEVLRRKIQHLQEKTRDNNSANETAFRCVPAMFH